MDRDDFIKAWSSFQLNTGKLVTYQALEAFIYGLADTEPQLKDRLLSLLLPDRKLPELRVELGQKEAPPADIDIKKYAKRFSREEREELRAAGITQEKAIAYLSAHGITAVRFKEKSKNDWLERVLADFGEQYGSGHPWKIGDPVRPLPPI